MTTPDDQAGTSDPDERAGDAGEDGRDAFDVVVIGGGAAGENCADRAGRHGRSVALVETDLVGGECSYWACMPSKTLLRPLEVLAAARRVPGARAAVTGGVDVAATFRSRDEVAAHYDDASQEAWVEGAGITLVRGWARLDGPRRVVVDADDGRRRVLEASHAVVLATGSTPVLPPVEGLAEARPWTSREATSTSSAPRRLVVIGGGVVACEMAQALASLGSEEVTVLVRGDRLLAGEEPVAGEQVARAFADAGIEVRFGTEATAVRRPEPGGPVTVELDDGTTVEADEVLVATGRRPATTDVGVESVGLEPGAAVAVDAQLRATGVEGGWLYAVGDVNGRVLLTHMGKYQARIAGDHICGVEGVADRASGDLVPRVVFTDPQVAAVGRTEAQAREDGLDVRVVDYALEDVGGATIAGEGHTGTVRLVVDEDRRVLVGATFTGPGVGELLHAATVAVAGAVPLEDLWHAVPAYPTVSEVWLRLLEAYGL